MPRSTAADGLRNKFETFIMSHFGPLWRLAQAIPPLDRWLNKVLINRAVGKCPFRPNPLSLMSDYPSWDSLTDRTYSGRHLPPASQEFTDKLQSLAPLPGFDPRTPLEPPEWVIKLFQRDTNKPRTSNKSTVLFSNFAQWFTDGFLRTDYDHDFPKKNTSNHEIDISPLYGRTKEMAESLRAKDGTGRLKSQTIAPQARPDGSVAALYGGGEFPPYYYDDKFVSGETSDFDMSKPPVREGFEIPGMAPLPRELFFLLQAPYMKPGEGLKRMRHRFAMGVERANSQIGYVMLNVLFLREHNRLCGLLKRNHPTWDDERLYQTARNTVIVMLIRIVVEEYINHISPYCFKFRAQPQSFYESAWQRPNWMAIEFALLYRWHGLVPDQIDLGTRTFSMMDTLFNNDLLLEEGLATAIDSASKQKASVVGLMNTTPLLVRTAEMPSLMLARAARLRSYNDYREFAQFPRVRHFNEITENEELQKRLQEIYREPDNIEFFVGLFAEDAPPRSAVPPLIGRLVAVDAFSQALTNPLLSEHVFKPETFAEGWEEFQNTPNLEAVVRRNIPGERSDVLVTMTQR